MGSTTGSFQKVSVIGLGYIGLPTAATLATRGLEVVGVDVKVSVVERLNAGKAHFSEPDLDMLLEAAVTTGKLRAITQPEPADAFIIAVPTPFNRDKSADLSSVESAARSLAPVLERGNLVVLESTSPVGTTEQLCEWLAEERPDLVMPTEHEAGDIYVAYCPERILPGRMVFELVENDRIIGGVNHACGRRAEELYRLFVRGDLHQTKAPIAEVVKLTENAYRDVNIAFANELSVLCENLGLNVWEAIRLANRHPRVNILTPGPGVGGHCIAVDPWFLISASPQSTPLMRAARDVNDTKPHLILETVRRQMDRFKKPVVACLGLSYKPNVDDLRSSPAVQIVEQLAIDNVELLVCEPHLKTLPTGLSSIANVKQARMDEAIMGADIVVVLVAHDIFKTAPREAMLSKVVIDTTGFFQEESLGSSAAAREAVRA